MALDTFFGVHFNWRISLIGLKMRMSVMTAVYRKCLTARFVDSNAPEMLNLMSTDTDRLVNSCISFHSFWSIPFQVSVQQTDFNHLSSSSSYSLSFLFP